MQTMEWNCAKADGEKDEISASGANLGRRVPPDPSVMAFSLPYWVRHHETVRKRAELEFGSDLNLAYILRAGRHSPHQISRAHKTQRMGQRVTGEMVGGQRISLTMQKTLFAVQTREKQFNRSPAFAGAKHLMRCVEPGWRDSPVLRL
jgi:hypothetical protein